MWEAVLSFLVIFHLTAEFAHYGYEFWASRREGKTLKDIQTHRQASTVSKSLARIEQRLIDLEREEKVPARLLEVDDSTPYKTGNQWEKDCATVDRLFGNTEGDQNETDSKE